MKQYTNVGKIRDDFKKPLIFTTFGQTDQGHSSVVYLPT